MSPFEAVRVIEFLVGKMGGLTVSECQQLLSSLHVIKTHLEPKPPKKLDVVPQNP